MLDRRRSSRTRRRAGVLALVLVLLAAAAYGVDAASRAAAESLVARAIERAHPAPAHAQVSVKGLFFLPQVVEGRYDHVHVHLDRISDQGLAIRSLDADLYDVRIPLARVVRQTVAAIPVGHSRERAVLTYAALNRYLQDHGEPIAVSAGHGNQLRLSAHLTVLGHALTVSADAKVRPGDGYLDVIPTQLDTGSGLLTAASRKVLSARLTFRIPTSPLPFGQHAQSIRPTGSGLVIVATGEQVVIYPSGTQPSGTHPSGPQPFGTS